MNGGEDLDPGEAAARILIPRAVVIKELSQLGYEFVELQKLLAPFIEMAIESRPADEVRTTSVAHLSVWHRSRSVAEASLRH